MKVCWVGSIYSMYESTTEPLVDRSYGFATHNQTQEKETKPTLPNPKKLGWFISRVDLFQVVSLELRGNVLLLVFFFWGGHPCRLAFS